jgi:hypothetical protein
LEPRFLIVELCNGKSFKKISPFAQKRGVLLLVGEVKSSKCLRDGTLLIEVRNCEQSKKLQAAQTFDTLPIRVTPHKSLNSSKGLVFCHDLLDLDVEEIKKELAPQHVTDVYRMMSRKTGSLKPTPLLQLTFGTPKIPEFIFAGYIRLFVRPHIPNPLRCFKCQTYGHPSEGCTRKSACAKCSSEDHDADACTNPALCVNCSGNHPVWSRDCPQWILERRIQEIKVKEGISVFDARKRLNISKAQTYAKTVESGAADSAETARLQAMLEKQLQLSTEQAKRHEEMEERHRVEVEGLNKRLNEKTEEINGLKLQITELLEARTLQLVHSKPTPTPKAIAADTPLDLNKTKTIIKPAQTKKTPITFDSKPLASSVSTSLSTRRDDMDIEDSSEEVPNTPWHTARGRERGKGKSLVSSHGSSHSS